MGQFLRFAALILLVLIGFGSGICGLFGLMTVPGIFRLGGINVGLVLGLGVVEGLFNAAVFLGLSAVGCMIAVWCFFGVRALARSLRRSAQTKPPK